MKPRSAKNKGKRLQNLVRDKILEAFPELTNRDVVSTTMGESGADIKLSQKAFDLFGYDVECKNLKAIAIYKFYNQRAAQEGDTLLVLKQNESPPLAVVSLDHFMELIKNARRP